MKKVLFWGTLVVILTVANVLIAQKENTLAHGGTMLLRLAPVDPRSLMQGDYMVLRYTLARDIPERVLDRKGRIVVKLDKNNVASFVRVHKNEALQPGEHLLFYRNRHGLRLGAESFLFQEGDANLYAMAKYGELKVDSSGAAILAGLRDENFSPLEKPARPGARPL